MTRAPASDADQAAAEACIRPLLEHLDYVGVCCVELLDVGDVLFERNRLGVAGRGVARRVAIEDVDAALAAIEIDDEVGLFGFELGEIAVSDRD